MTIRLLTWISLALLFVAGPAAAQQLQSGPPRPGAVQPRPPQQIRPPFALTPQQQAAVDSVLQAWQRESSLIKRFQCEFTRFEYDGLSPTPKQPAHVDIGEIKYESPDKGMYHVKGELIAGRVIEGPRTERWVSDGKSVFEYDFKKRQLTEHPLPEELQGKAIANGPMPFLFGAKADQLNARYWLRLIESPPDNQDQIWLQAIPKRREDAASYRVAEIILTGAAMQPTALLLIAPNGKDRTSFSFSKIQVNNNNPLDFLKGNPFKGATPLGWKKIVMDQPAQQIGGQPPAGNRR